MAVFEGFFASFFGGFSTRRGAFCTIFGLVLANIEQLCQIFWLCEACQTAGESGFLAAREIRHSEVWKDKLPCYYVICAHVFDSFVNEDYQALPTTTLSQGLSSHQPSWEKHTTFLIDALLIPHSVVMLLFLPGSPQMDGCKSQHLRQHPAQQQRAQMCPPRHGGGCQNQKLCCTHRGMGMMSAAESCYSCDAWPLCSVRACLCLGCLGSGNTRFRLH